MNYLQDKKLKKKKYIRIAIFIGAILLVIYFGSVIFSGFSTGAHFIFRPFLVIGNNIGDKFSSFGAYFSSKNNLTEENERLRNELDDMTAKIANYDPVLEENEHLKEVLNRKKETQNLVLSAILSKPNQSLYDTLIIDRGSNHGIQVGNMVYALGNIPVGTVSEVYNRSSTVTLFSSSGIKTGAIVTGEDTFIEAVGRGGGNFEMLLPRDLVVEKGTEIILPGVNSQVMGFMEAVISEPRDAFQKILVVSPVNIQQLKFVQVEI